MGSQGDLRTTKGTFSGMLRDERQVCVSIILRRIIFKLQNAILSSQKGLFFKHLYARSKTYPGPPPVALAGKLIKKQARKLFVYSSDAIMVSRPASP